MADFDVEIAATPGSGSAAAQVDVELDITQLPSDVSQTAGQDNASSTTAVGHEQGSSAESGVRESAAQPNTTVETTGGSDGEIKGQTQENAVRTDAQETKEQTITASANGKETNEPRAATGSETPVQHTLILRPAAREETTRADASANGETTEVPRTNASTNTASVSAESKEATTTSATSAIVHEKKEQPRTTTSETETPKTASVSETKTGEAIELSSLKATSGSGEKKTTDAKTTTDATAKSSTEKKTSKESESKPSRNTRTLVIENGKLKPQADSRGKPIKYRGNEIQTYKYTVLNFIPKTLFEQFLRPANFYFLIVMILQTYRPISTTQGFPSIIFALSFVVAVSALKALYEDLKRREEDKKENMRRCAVLNTESGQYKDFQSRQLKVGDLVRVYDDQVFPADLLLLQSGLDDGAYCYVETSNVDGETNLKIKIVPDGVKGRVGTDKELAQANLELACDSPNGSLERWNAYLTAYSTQNRLNQDSLLLRGTKLRNAVFVLALVVYTGEDCKIRMNSSERNPRGLFSFLRSKIKKSHTEAFMEKLIIGMFFFQISLCFVCGALNGIWEKNHQNHFYLMLSTDYIRSGLAKVGTWFLTFVNFVPISLLVSMEMVKFLQGRFLGWDVMMSAVVGEELHFARAQTSALNEELGQIQYVLSDKTGTLTCNSMDFRKAIIGASQFGTGETDISRGAGRKSFDHVFGSEPECKEPPLIAPHVNFNGKKSLDAVLYDRSHPDFKYAREFFLGLSLGNTVFPTTDAHGDPEFKASSPDEECLVQFANCMGFALAARNPPVVTIAMKIENNPTQQFSQVACLDFTSKRKHMAVIVRNPDKTLSMYAKGADAFIQPLLEGYGDKEKFAAANPHFPFTTSRLDRFAFQGLRTLLVAAAHKPASWWDDPHTGWKLRYEARMKECTPEGPEEEGHIQGNCSKLCRRCALELEVELDAGLRLVGATAIEDKLQDFVPLTIKNLLEAGIKVWVLTGDKLETAINIAMACNLLEANMPADNRLLMVDGTDAPTIRKLLEKHDDTLKNKQTSDPFGLVFTSAAFLVIEEAMETEPALVDLFVSVATRCKSCVGCRMQPNQKAKVVKLVKDTQKVTTLAIGDGANDEQMIREAHVGVGIRGVEGTTAVRAADYAISQFHFLRRLLFVWGRCSYRQIANMLGWIMYKQAMICFVLFFMGLLSGFSGTQLFLEWTFQFYSVGYTAFMLITFAVLDRDIDNRELMSQPHIYQKTHKGEMFTGWIFLRWMITSFVQATIIFWVVQFAYNTETDDVSGRAIDHWFIGLVVYTCVVLIANLKMCIMIAYWNWVNHLALWPTIVGFFFFNLVFSAGPSFSISGGDYTWAMFHLLSTPLFYIVLFVTIVSALLFDYAWTSIEELKLFCCCGRQAQNFEQTRRKLAA